MGTVLGFDSIAFWIVVTSALVNVTGGLLGCYLVLRRLSLLGDAISHAILPGIAIAFIITATRDPIPMLIGALIAGVLTAVFTQLIHKYTNVPEDAAMGVVFTSLFALGVIMISRVAKQVELDPGCVLYGVLESAALDTRMFLGMEIPQVTLTLAVVFLVVLAFIIVLWKELKIVSFDPHLATTLGINAQVVHYMLMAMVAAFTVAAFEAVGSILVVAMLIAPAATAYLLTDRLHWMMILASIAGIAAAIIARVAAAHYETSVAGMVATVAGVLFLLAVFFAPRYGFLSKKMDQAQLALRVVREDLLALMYRWQEIMHERPLRSSEAVAVLGGGLAPRVAMWSLRRGGDLQSREDTIELSDQGRTKAGSLIHKHRLWEAYLAKHFELPEDHLHSPADRMEHFIDEQLIEQVAAEVGQPHGPMGHAKKELLEAADLEGDKTSGD